MSRFFQQVYRVVRLIPPGKVATYGQIAALLGHPRAARTLGLSMHALLEGSPAIDACVNNCTVNRDQRGFGRPQYDSCDIGAYEVREPPVQRAPAFSLWGTVGLAVVMAGLLVWSARRRLLLKNRVK